MPTVTAADAVRLRERGEVAAGGSHDLRNILNGMSLRLQCLEDLFSRADRRLLVSSIDKLQRDLAIGLGIVDRLDVRGPVSPSELGDVDFDELVHQACDLSRTRAAARASVSIGVSCAARCRIRASAADVVTAVVNLIVNAVDASRARGVVTVETGAEETEVWVRVADHGAGLPPEVEAHLFEPFLTTKGAKGTGLGLWQVATCAKNHGGRIAVESAPGHGTTFTLSFRR